MLKIDWLKKNYLFIVFRFCITRFNACIFNFIGISFKRNKIVVFKTEFSGSTLSTLINNLFIWRVPLISIELISYCARVLSLSIRLFADMLSGPTLLTILSSFVWKGLNYILMWLSVQIAVTPVIKFI